MSESRTVAVICFGAILSILCGCIVNTIITAAKYEYRSRTINTSIKNPAFPESMVDIEIAIDWLALDNTLVYVNRREVFVARDGKPFAGLLSFNTDLVASLTMLSNPELLTLSNGEVQWVRVFALLLNCVWGYIFGGILFVLFLYKKMKAI